MVESGSTTEYVGGGTTFPNWITYDSGLFEVKVNGMDAVFIAPEPVADLTRTGRIYHNPISAPMDNNLKADSSTGYVQLVNIVDGVVGERPIVNSSTYINTNQNDLPASQLIDTISDEHPLYLYDPDWGAMAGRNYLDFNLEDLPHIICPEMQLILIYDADYGEWKTFNGTPLNDLKITWRFKQLYDIKNAPVFLDIQNIRYNETYIDKAYMLNPSVSMIPNETSPNLFEVHAHTTVCDIINDGRQFGNPRFKGTFLSAWPNHYSDLLTKPGLMHDESIIRLPVININQSNVAIRINNNPAWIVENTIPEYSEDYNPINIDEYYFSSDYNQTEQVFDVEGGLTITDGNTVFQYNASTCVWQVTTSDTYRNTLEMVTVSLLPDNPLPEYRFTQDIRQSILAIDLLGNDYNLYVGIVLINPALSPNKVESPNNFSDVTEKFINHERVTALTNTRLSPNFENFDIRDYALRANGKYIEPDFQYGVNDAILQAYYNFDDLGIGLVIDIENITTYLNYNQEAMHHQATAPEGMTYLLDGNREDNLDMNTTTGMFNRYIPLVLQWDYNQVQPIEDHLPLFISLRSGEGKSADHHGDSTMGIYVDYNYSDTHKSASLSYAPRLTVPGENAMDTSYHPSLAFVPERDVIRGWKKHGYTGKLTHVYDYAIGESKIGWPIIIREDEVDEQANDLNPLPLTLVAEFASLEGSFDIRINGEIVATDVNNENIMSVLEDLSAGLVIEDTGEETPVTYRSPTQSGEMVIDGLFDLYIDGELVGEDVTVEDILNASYEGNIPLEVFTTTPPEPEPEIAQPK